MIGGEVIVVNDLLSDILAMDSHVLEDFHVRAKKKIFEITGTVASAMHGIGDGPVQVEFGVNNANSGGADILIGIKAVASNRHGNAVSFSFARVHGADKIGIGIQGKLRGDK